MSDADDMDLERGGDDMLAAEYVLGALSADERHAASLRIESDVPFARMVDAWEVRLSGLAEAYAEVAPHERVKQAIDRRLFSSAASPRRPGLLASLAFWRGLTAAAVAALLLVVGLPYLSPAPIEQPAPRLVASMAADQSPVRYVAVYDAANGEIGMSRLGDDRHAGRDFELWAIEGNDAPVSLGVIPAGANARMSVSEEMRGRIERGVVFAITDEPQGGSPTGDPTGPVVAAGDLHTI